MYRSAADGASGSRGALYAALWACSASSGVITRYSVPPGLVRWVSTRTRACRGAASTVTGAWGRLTLKGMHRRRAASSHTQ